MINIKIIVATHKKYSMPSDAVYLPLHVGREGKTDLGYTGDNTGNNISLKNPNYCELTGLYWAWKNLFADYLGLVHYRRYFAAHNRIARQMDFEKALTRVPVILPCPRHYWIETNYTQYIHAHHLQDLTITRDVLLELYPSYLPAYDRQMKLRSGHRFNMFIMRRDLFDAYCQWIFNILFEIESRLDISKYDAYNARVFGFIAERLLDVWIETNQVPYTEMPVKNTEKQHWIRKGIAFIKRKYSIRNS